MNNNRFKGKLVSGTGRGAKFISMVVYSTIFQDELGEKPFPGTFNLIIDHELADTVNNYFEIGNKYENLKHENKPTGGIITNKFKLIIKANILISVGVRPILTVHNSSILEIVSSINLRDTFSLNNDDIIDLEFI